LQLIVRLGFCLTRAILDLSDEAPFGLTTYSFHDQRDRIHIPVAVDYFLSVAMPSTPLLLGDGVDDGDDQVFDTRHFFLGPGTIGSHNNISTEAAQKPSFSQPGPQVCIL
jgi:hypothetical protein